MTTATPPRDPKALRNGSPLNPLTWVAAYTHWLHTRWPAGTVEKLPLADGQGRTNVPGLYLVGDLTGVPLLKLSANAGVEAARRVADELEGEEKQDDVLDLAIVGGGTSGFAAAKEAEKLGLRYAVFESSEPFSTIVNFPKGKHIYTYPTETQIEGDLVLHEKSDLKEGLIEDLREQTVDDGIKWVIGRVDHVERGGGMLEIVVPDKIKTPDGVNLNGTGFVGGKERVKAKRVIVGIGRSGNYRKLDVPGEEHDKVYNRLHDPADYADQNVLVVGGGDSAMETAVALADAGAAVTLSYRKAEFNRPKPENVEKLNALAGDGGVTLLMSSNVKEIRDGEAEVETAGGEVTTVANDSVFTMIGREPPLDFFRKSGVKIRDEHDWKWWASLAAFLTLCLWLYHWKGSDQEGKSILNVKGWYMPAWLQLDPAPAWQWVVAHSGGLQSYLGNVNTLGGTIVGAAQHRAFYYTLAYCLCVVIFGVRRIRRRRTPYVFWQTLTLMTIQCVPLFILPEILLPWLGRNGHFDGGPLGWVADWLFPRVDYAPGREYWRSYGLVLAWPLMAWNWFTGEPVWGWIILGSLQTFVLIPAMVWYWGKGAYCGWICSCGALAETLGDTQRHKMPHGPFWNRLNMVGQVLLGFGLVIQLLFVLRWSGVGWAREWSDYLATGVPLLSWSYFVDLIWAGVLGVGVYFWLSGRFWCRFACPLAALMHVYDRFGRFAILADKKKCISCNVCTSVCHQGIDVMSFANKGKPMQDPQCVRCSACVQMCPTGVLSFGRVDKHGDEIGHDPAWLAASPVRIRESAPVRMTVNGRHV